MKIEKLKKEYERKFEEITLEFLYETGRLITNIKIIEIEDSEPIELNIHIKTKDVKLKDLPTPSFSRLEIDHKKQVINVPSTQVGKTYWPGLAIGAALSGIGIIIGLNLRGIFDRIIKKNALSENSEVKEWELSG